MTTVAALYIDPKGPYGRMARGETFRVLGPHGELYCRELGPLRDIDCWDAGRDARRYEGPHPVVAHPPCKHWGRLAYLAKVKCSVCCRSFRVCDLDGEEDEPLACPECLGEPDWSDRDCAPRAVGQVRRWGGVLEHPAGSKLWEHCGLPSPCPTCRGIGWIDGALGDALCPDCRPDTFGGYAIEIDQVEWGHVARKRTWLYLVGEPREALEVPPFPGRAPTHSMGNGRAKRMARGQGPLKEASAEQRRRTPPLFAEYLVRLARTVPHSESPHWGVSASVSRADSG